jgi:hypothetical protein
VPCTKVAPELAEAAARRMEGMLGDLEELADQPGLVVNPGCQDGVGGPK